MEKKNLNLTNANMLPAEPVAQPNMNSGRAATMDVTGSLRKISRELLELTDMGYDLHEDVETRLEGASWLIAYIADCLDVELKHAYARGLKQQTERMNGNVQVKGPSMGIIRGEEI